MRTIKAILVTLAFLAVGVGNAYAQCPTGPGWSQNCLVSTVFVPDLGQSCTFQVCYCVHRDPSTNRLTEVRILSISPQSPCLLTPNYVEEVGRELGRLLGGPCGITDNYTYDYASRSPYCFQHNASPAPYGTYNDCGGGYCETIYTVKCNFGAFSVGFKSRTSYGYTCPPPGGGMPCTYTYSPCAP